MTGVERVARAVAGNIQASTTIASGAAVGNDSSLRRLDAHGGEHEQGHKAGNSVEEHGVSYVCRRRMIKLLRE